LMDALKQSLAQMGKKGAKGNIEEEEDSNRIHAVGKKSPARATAKPRGKRSA